MMRGDSGMASAVDLSGLANLERFVELLVLALLAAMVYFGRCGLRRRRTSWGLVFTGSAVGGLILHGGLFLGRGVLAGMRSMGEARETPGVGPSFETWALVYGIGELLAGASVLLAGVALIYLGWYSGREARSRPGSSKTKN